MPLFAAMVRLVAAPTTTPDAVCVKLNATGVDVVHVAMALLWGMKMRVSRRVEAMRF